MAGLNKDDVDLHFNTNQFNEDDHAKQISFFYKALYQINDIVLGIIFLIGSFLFLVTKPWLPAQYYLWLEVFKWQHDL